MTPYKLQKKDFIEMEFKGKIKETGKIFDSNSQEELEKMHAGHDHPIEAKPFIYCLGEGMFLEGADKKIIGQEIGKHKIELNAEEAFGNRMKELVQTIPMKIFIQHKINPVKGATMNFDGRVGKVLSVSGGRVLIDFNHPLAGKDLVYEIDIKRKIDDLNEKINGFNNFLFKKDLSFKIDGKKIVYEISDNPENENMKKFIELFKDKFKDIFEMDLEVNEIKEI